MSVRFSFQGPRQAALLPSALGSRILLAAPVSSTLFSNRPSIFFVGGFGRRCTRPRLPAFAEICAVRARVCSRGWLCLDRPHGGSAPVTSRAFARRRTSQRRPLSRFAVRGVDHYAVVRFLGQGDFHLFLQRTRLLRSQKVNLCSRAHRLLSGALTGFPHVEGRWVRLGFRQGYRSLRAREPWGEPGFPQAVPTRIPRMRGLSAAACGVGFLGEGGGK